MRYNRSQIEAQKKKKPLRHFRNTPQQEQPVVIPTPFPAEEKKPEEPAKEEVSEEKPKEKLKEEGKKNLKIKHKEKVKEEKPQSEQEEAKSTNTNPSEEQLEAFKKKIKEILQQ